MSTLEAFRKQAKQLVRWHRAGNHSIGGRIRGLRRYKDVTDLEALQLRFPLAEAQEIIALEAGFESWAALKAALPAAPLLPRHQGSLAAIKAAIPVLFVAEVASSARFFHDRLGFAIEFLHGHPAFYAGVARDGVSLHLRCVHEVVINPAVREQESLLAAFIVVANVKALFEEYKAKQVAFVETLRKQPWGGPAFTVCDLDGNRICFSEIRTVLAGN